ncbi:MAG: MaoC family dehydratase [Polyangiales bacterium]
MQHSFAELPSSLPAYIGILGRPRQYRGEPLPTIEASVASARFDAARLDAYRALVHAPRNGQLPLFAPQLLAAPLHLRLLADPAFPFPALGLVHLTNRIALHAPIPEDAALTLSAHVDGVLPHRLGHAVTLRTSARLVGEGAAVWTAETVALARRKDAAAERGPRAARAPDTLDLTDAITFEVPEPTGRAYARVAGDLNPIHQHALLARPFGLRRAIVHGTFTAARAMSALWPDADTQPGEVLVRFHAPVFLPSRVRMGRTEDGLAVCDADTGRVQVRVSRKGPA